MIVLALFLVVVAQVFSTNPVSAYGADGIVKITVKIAPADSAPGIVVKVKRGTTSRVGDTEVTLSRQNADTFVGDMKVMNADCSSGTQAERNFNATVYNNSGGGPTGSVMQTIGTSSTSQICGNPSSFNFNVTIQPVTPSTTKGSICGNLSYWDPVAKKAMPYQTNNSNIIAVQEGTGTKTAMVKTDDSGHYCIGNVTPGKYKLTASYVKGTTNMDTWNSGVFDVTAGQTTDMSHAATDPSNPPPGGTEPGADEETCNVTGVGWIVCPVAAFIASVTDAVYALVENMLVFNVNDPFGDNPLKQIWSNVLNIANIAFVLAFFAVIFSQATSIGISAYGIRKMLPRIIAAAILVNLSYYICVFAIDISNIIGAGIDGIIMSALPAAQSTGLSWSTVIVDGLLIGVAAGAAAAGAGPAMLSAGLAFCIAALIAIITALIILVARQAILIMIIVLSPLAFAAYILPNTEDLFNKWRKLFITMLVFYPLVAILFSGSKVASAIMQQAAPPGITGGLVQVFSLGVLAFPLFATPFLLKFSGGLLGRIAGVVNNPNKGPLDRLRKRGEASIDSRRDRQRSAALSGDGNRFQRATRNRFAQRRVDRDNRLRETKRTADDAQQEYTADRLSSDSKYAQKVAGTSDAARIATIQARAQQELIERKAKDRSAQYTLMQTYGFDDRDFKEIATGDSAGNRVSNIKGHDITPQMLEAVLHARIGQGRDFEAIVAHAAKLTDPAEKKAVMGYVADAADNNYDKMKVKSAAATDVDLKRDLRAGSIDTTNAQAKLQEAAGKAAANLSEDALASQMDASARLIADYALANPTTPQTHKIKKNTERIVLGTSPSAKDANAATVAEYARIP